MQTVRLCLIGMAISLLLMGVITGTPVRYAIQLLPIPLALHLTSRAPGYLGAYGAVAISSAWAGVTVLIWLVVLSVSDVPAGDYPPAVIALTMPVAFFAFVGILRGVRAGRPLARSRKVVTLLLFGILQALATLGSFIEPFVNR
jgi:hypothetical protein